MMRKLRVNLQSWDLPTKLYHFLNTGDSNHINKKYVLQRFNYFNSYFSLRRLDCL